MRKTTSAFTIVELLIVIVVIAILAAISIVAYNGIQERSRASAANSAASQAKKKLELAKIDNSDQYPATLAAAGISNSGSTNYQYTTTGTTFCLTVSVSGTSYNVSNTTGPTAGACTGHTNGGSTIITNLALNPNAASTTGFSYGGPSGSFSIETSGANNGDSFLRRTFTGSGYPSIMLGNNTSNMAPVTAGLTYTASGYVKFSTSKNAYIRINWFDSTGAALGNDQGAVTGSGTSWTRLSRSGAAPANAAYARIFINASETVSAGEYIDVDGIMLTEGTEVYNFADGSTPGWSWNGTPNNSTSTGPAV